MLISVVVVPDKGERINEPLVLKDGSTIRDALTEAHRRGWWPGGVSKLWLNGTPKNEPLKDMREALKDGDELQIQLPQTYDVWQID